jgi:hypothetical protein
MTVVSTTIVQVKPDRFEEWLDVMRKAKPILEGYGARNVRVLVGLVAGQATGTIVTTLEVDDFAAAGAVQDKAIANPEVREMLSVGDASPMSGFQTSQFIDIPL